MSSPTNCICCGSILSLVSLYFKLIIIHYYAVKKGNKIQTKDKIEPHVQLVGGDVNS